MNPTISLAAPEDLETILAIQHVAFLPEAELHNDLSIPPLTETLDALRADLSKKVFLKASVAGELVGSIRGSQEGATCFVERLSVRQDHRNRGIGTALMRAIEERFPTARRFELCTGVKSENNIRLYRKLGYAEFKWERAIVFMAMTR